jgi:hypothetical protein
MPEPPSQEAGLFQGREFTLCSSLGVPSAFLPLVLEAQAESRRSEARDKRVRRPCFMGPLVDDLIPDFEGAGWSAREDIGDRSLGVDSDCLNFSNHFFATIDDHGESLDELIIFAKVEDDEIPCGVHCDDLT